MCVSTVAGMNSRPVDIALILLPACVCELTEAYSRMQQEILDSSARPLCFLSCGVHDSEHSALVRPRDLHQGVAVGLEGGAVRDREALAAAALAAQLAHERGHHCLISLVQSCIHLIKQEQP